jgi:MFS family permease
MMLMDFMGVSVALPEVRRALNGSFSEMQWVLEAFVLTLAAFVLTAGYVADLAGRRLEGWRPMPTSSSAAACCRAWAGRSCSPRARS